MDFLSKSFAQIRELFLSLTPGARITAALLLGVIMVSVGYLFHTGMSGPDDYLMGGEPFDSDQLRVMEAAFGKAGLSKYERDGNRIRIPRGMQSAYMGALADAGAMPRGFGSYLEDAINKDGLFESNRTKQERMTIARQRELSLIIRAMPGIRDASVLFDRQKARGLSPTDVVTASVSVRTRTDEPLETRQVQMIRKLVAASFAGLKAQDVTVGDLSGRVYSVRNDEGLLDASEDPYYSRKAQFEQRLEEKIRAHLANFPGIQVHVSAELSKELSHHEQRVILDPNKATNVQSRTSKVTKTDERGAGGGRPGLEAQGPGGGAVALAGAKTTKSKEESRDEETQSIVPSQQVEVEMTGLTPQRVRASIAVPSSYYRDVWAEKNRPADGQASKPPTEQELDDLKIKINKNIVTAVLPLLPNTGEGVDTLDRVTVTTFQSLPPDPIEPPSLTEEALAWTGQYWTTLSMMGLALFSLVMLRSMLRSPPTGPDTGSQTAATFSLVGEADETAGSENADRDERPHRRFVRGPSFKDELAEMVREDPDTAANILRSWIANAG